MTNTTTNKTALQTANELLASNSANRAWDIANGRIPSIYSGNAFGPKARFWMAVAQWIALNTKRNIQKANWNTATSATAPLSEMRS